MERTFLSYPGSSRLRVVEEVGLVLEYHSEAGREEESVWQIKGSQFLFYRVVGSSLYLYFLSIVRENYYFGSLIGQSRQGASCLQDSVPISEV